MKNFFLRLPGRRTYIFRNFDILVFPTFKRLLSKFLRENFQVSKNILKVLINFYVFTNIYDLKFLDNETTALWLFFFFFFEICTEEHFASQILSNEGNVNASILLILLKCIVLGCSDGNESFIGKLFQVTGRWICYSIFFDISFIVFFTRLLSKSFWKNCPFSAQISKIHFKM